MTEPRGPIQPAYGPSAGAPPPRSGIPTGIAIALIVGTLVLVAGGVTLVVNLAGNEEDPSPVAVDSPAPGPTATPAGSCSEVIEEPATLEPVHLDPGEPLPQTDLPATSGPHASATVSAGVYTQPIDEAQALHSLEHGYVVIWYDPDTTSQETFDALAGVHGNQAEVIMAPYDLDGPGVVFVSWERIQGCDPGADPETVAFTASEFIASYKNAPNAPEPLAP